MQFAPHLKQPPYRKLFVIPTHWQKCSSITSSLIHSPAFHVEERPSHSSNMLLYCIVHSVPCQAKALPNNQGALCFATATNIDSVLHTYTQSSVPCTPLAALPCRTAVWASVWAGVAFCGLCFCRPLRLCRVPPERHRRRHHSSRSCSDRIQSADFPRWHSIGGRLKGSLASRFHCRWSRGR